MAGLLALIARYGRNFSGSVAVVGVSFSWPAALAILAVALLFRYGQRGGLRKAARMYPRLAAVQRRIAYLRRLGTHSPAAKEIRILGCSTGSLTAIGRSTCPT